jgi:beta-D-xylosidase 4
MKNRVRVCPPKSANSTALCGAPPPAPLTCNRTALPLFCDPEATLEARLTNLLAAMTTEEKVSQVGSNTVPAIPRLGIPAYEWWGEALHGVCESPSVTFQPPTPTATSFPEPIGMASTFDMELFAAVGGAIGLEARVMMNVGNAGGTFWAPNINVVKDPRWGRLQV